MADEQKRILLDIESNLDQYRQEATQAGKSVKDLQEELKRLKKEGGDNSEQIEQTNERLRAARKDYREATKSVDDLTRANQAQEGSYEQLQSQLRLAEKSLRTQAGLLTRNADGTIELSESYVEASKEVEQARGAVNQFNTGIHDGRTSVGLYQESIQKALGDVRVFGVSGNQVANTFGKAVPSGMAAGTAGVKSFTAAFIASGIGAIILAIVGAIALLRKAWQSFAGRYDEQMDKLRATTAALKTMFDAFVDGIVAGIKYIKDLTKWVTSFGKTAKPSFESAERSLREVFETARELERMQQRLNDRMKEFEVESAKANLRIRELEEIYKDVRLSDQERLEAAKDARDIEIKRAEEELKLAEQQYHIIVEQNKLSKSGRADREAELAAEKALYEAQERSLSARIRINRNLSTLEEGIRKDREADQKRIQDAIDKERQAREAMIEAIRDARLTDIEKLQKEMERQLSLHEWTAEERMEIERHFQFQMAEIRRQETEAKQAEADEELKRRSDVLEQIRQAGLDDIEKLEEELTAKLELHEWDHEERVRIEEYYNERIAEIREAQRSAEDQAREKKKQEDKAAADAEIALQEMVLEAKIAASQSLLAAMSEFSKKGSAINKAFAVADALINTYKGVTAALAMPAGPPASFIAAAATLTQGMAAVKKIMQTAPGKASTGGAGGSSPSRGGGFVASRAGGAIAASDQAFTSIGQQAGESRGTASQVQIADSSSQALVDAIKQIKPVVTVEEFERVRDRKNMVESKAGY